MCANTNCDLEFPKHSRFLIGNELNNNENSNVFNAKKCLFGAPNIDDIMNLFEDDLNSAQDRLFQRFGVDINAIENIERGNSDVDAPELRKKKHCRVPRNVLKPYNKQYKITESFKVKKNLSTKKEKE